MARGPSPRSVARAVACFRGFFRFLVLDGTRRQVRPTTCSAPRAWKALPKYLSIEDVDRLIAQPDVTRRAAFAIAR